MIEEMLPKIEGGEVEANHGRYTIAPLEPGFGTTIGNALRRVLLAALPASPDPVTLPGELVALFRVVSLAGQVVLWGVLGAVFGLLLARGGRTVGHAPASDPLLPSSWSAR